MPSWVRLVAVESCPPGHCLEAIAEDRVIAMFNVGGEFHALDGVCPHQGGPLGKGRLAGCVVTCPWHGWQFDVRTGEHQITPTIRQPTFSVRVIDGWIEVDLDTPA